MDAELLKKLEQAQAAGRRKKQRKAERRESDKDKNRQEMPNVAEMLDGLRAQGLTFTVEGAEDLVTGKKVGKI